MSDASTRERSGSPAASADADDPDDSWFRATVSTWRAWIVAAAALAVAAYFFTPRGIWTTGAERWYVIIAGGATLLALAYGAYETRERATGL